MGKTSQSIVIAASPEAAWSYVGDFNGLARWHPGVAESSLEENGRVRRLQLRRGGSTVERLLELDPKRRIIRYSILESALPLRNHAARIAVSGSGTHSSVHWSCEFESAGPPDEELAAIFAQIFQVGLVSLKALLEKPAG